MRLDYTHTIRDERLGIDLAVQIECQIEASNEWVAGERRPTVSAVYIDGKNLFRGGEIAKAIAGDIANAAEAELLDDRDYNAFRQAFMDGMWLEELDKLASPTPRLRYATAYSALRVAG